MSNEKSTRHQANEISLFTPHYHKGKETTFGTKSKKRNRPYSLIPNSVTTSLTNTPETLLKNYGIDVKVESYDCIKGADGKLLKLGKKETELINALSYILTKHLEDEEVKKAIEKIKEAPGEKTEIPLVVLLEDICALTQGEKERTKKTVQEDVLKRLQELANKKSLQIFKTIPDNEDEEPIIIQIRRPYFFVGDEILITQGNKQKGAVEIKFQRTFLFNIEKRACPILESLFRVKNSEGNRINTALFWSLTNIVQSQYTYHVFSSLPKAIREVKGKFGKVDTWEKEKELKEELKKAERKALTHTITAERLKEITPRDYSSTRKQQRDFWEDLYEATRGLITYGIITEESSIEKRKGDGVVNVVFNPLFPNKTKNVEDETAEEYLKNAKYWKLEGVQLLLEF